MGYRVRSQDVDGRDVGTLSYCTDPAWDRRLRDAADAGPDAREAARVEAEEAGAFKHVNPGDDCSDVPAQSLDWLLDQGLIEVTDTEAEAAKKPTAKKAAKKPTAKKEQ